MIRGLSTFIIILVVVIGFGVLLWSNARPDTLVAVVPMQVEPTESVNVLPTILGEEFGSQSTVFPTIENPVQVYEPPTLPPASGPSPTPFGASDLSNDDLFTLQPLPLVVSPTPLAPTLTPNLENGTLVVQNVPTDDVVWNPPPLPVPLSLDPLGRDHYWFIRPVDSNANNSALRSYTYGADGLNRSNTSRIHHGIDLSNQVGQTVRAGGDGTVFFASSESDPYFQNTPSYGNIVVIEHFNGFDGQVLYTLYAHMERVFVETGQAVSAGDPIGLVGNSGQTTGAHLHFEVRMGGNRYGDTLNPLLWIAPYVGHGTIAGTLVNERGNLLNDVTITLRNLGTNSVQATTTTYIFDGTVNQVNSDPNYSENFVFGDIPVGRYRLVVRYEGLNITQDVTVVEGMTVFAELRPVIAATAQPVTPQP